MEEPTKGDTGNSAGDSDVAVMENKNPMNSAYVEAEDRPEDEYDVEREGNYTGDRKVVNAPFVIQQHLDPMRQRDPNGVYLDDIRRREAEVLRARVEDRKPDFDNMATTCGENVMHQHVAAAQVTDGAVPTPYAELPMVVGQYEYDEEGEVVGDANADAASSNKKSGTDRGDAGKTAEAKTPAVERSQETGNASALDKARSVAKKSGSSNTAKKTAAKKS